MVLTMWRTRNKNVSPNMRHGRGAAVAPETSGHRCGRRVESLFGGRPCRWKHFLLDNHLREKSTAMFSVLERYPLWQSNGKAKVASTLYQASIKGRLALDLETSVELERGAVDIDLIFFFFAELLLDLSWW